MDRGRGPFFHLPQPEQNPAPEDEPVAVPDVEELIHALVAQTRAATRAEEHRAIQILMEINMKVAELSTKVDALIGVANTLKATADAAPDPAASLPAEDDPEIEVLGQRIDDAIAVLQGARSASTPTPADSSALLPPVDPNAPV